MSTVVTTTLQDRVSSDNTAILDAIHGSAKAWVNFNGSGTPSISSSYNVSSITDNATGNFTINFTNSFADTNYASFGTANFTSGISWVATPRSGGTKSISALQISVVAAGVLADLTDISVSVFR